MKSSPKPGNKVFCFGELLLRFSPALNGEWIKQSGMPVFIGGAELNVARALAKWDIPVKYMTALPGNYLSNEIIEHLQAGGLDMSPLLLAGKRIGCYYLPQGTDLKSAGVIYDREGSSFAGLRPGMIDWDSVLEDCNWFHFSAISPALNENVAAVCREGLTHATQKGMTISIDLNYRSLLWQYGQQPPDVMRDLVQHCSVIMGNIWSAESLLQVESSIESSDGKTHQQLVDAAAHSILRLQKHYPSATCVAFTFRLQHEYFAVLQNGDARVVSKIIPVSGVEDKAGSGDCFMAGLIYGMCNNFSNDETVNYAATAAVGKLQERGDATNQTVDDIKSKLQ